MKQIQAVAATAWLGLAVLAGAQVPGKSQEAKPISFPTGYRTWAHVKSMVIHDKSHPLFAAFGGIHHVYANTKAAQALQKGGSHPDGSVFAFDLLEANSQSGAYVEGKRKLLAVMVKNSKLYTKTGGWGFEAFAEGNAAKRQVKEATRQCYGCHATQKKTDYVYSAWRP